MNNVLVKKQKYIHDFVTGFYLPVIKMNLTSRPLQVTWTPELAQDLTAYHNIDAEAELTNLLSENIAREIDNTILEGIRGMVEQDEYGVNWRTEDTWDLDGLYGSLIGVGMELKPLNFLPKKNISFLDSVTLPRVRRMFC